MSARWRLAAVEILTTGLPFCVFKLLTALVLWRAFGWTWVAAPLAALGALDALLNVANLAALATARRRVVGVCTAELVVRRAGGRSEVGLAIDVCLSFALVALVVGAGWIARLPTEGVTAWNAAVVLNVLGAGVGRLAAALKEPAVDQSAGSSVRTM